MSQENTNYLSRLNRILPPPAHPFQSSGDWRAAEEALGVLLPSDYKQFISQYGCGQVGNFLFVFNPHCRNPHVNLVSGAAERLEALRVLQAGGENVPYPLHPNAGGILPMGATDNGDTLFWTTKGPPDEWEIVVNEARGPQWAHFSCGLTDFLAGVLTETIRCSLFPASFPGDEAIRDTAFRPFDGNVLP